jgi:hypothetical protein
MIVKIPLIDPTTALLAVSTLGNPHETAVVKDRS